MFKLYCELTKVILNLMTVLYRSVIKRKSHHKPGLIIILNTAHEELR